MNKRIVANLVVFALLGGVLISWALRSFVGFSDPVSFEITADFEEAPGLREAYEVAYLGTSVGAITGIELQTGGVEVTMQIREEAAVPAAVRAEIRRRSAVGEPYVFLRPIEGEDLTELLASGTAIERELTDVSLSYASLFGALDDLLGAVPPDDLNTVVHELALAVDGRADTMRSLLRDVESITDTFAADADQIDAAFRQIAGLTSTIAGSRGDITRSMEDVREIIAMLDSVQPDLDRVMDANPTVLARLSQLLIDSEESLGCTVTALAAVTAGLDQESLDGLRVGIDSSPELIAILEDVLVEHDDQLWIRLLGQGDDEADIRPYDEPLPRPAIVPIPGCDGPTTASRVAVGTDDTAALGSGGSAAPVSGREQPSDAAASPDPDATSRASSEEFLETPSLPVAEVVATLLGILVLAVVGFAVAGRRRRRG